MKKEELLMKQEMEKRQNDMMIQMLMANLNLIQNNMNLNNSNQF